MIERNRIWFLDETRGLFILLMVLHHAAYDGVFLLGLPFDFLFTGWFGVIRTFFAGGFVLISGAACRFSHNNFRRGGRCLLLAYGLSLVTALVVPSQQIRFGVLHLLGFAMLLFAVLQPLLDRIPPAWGAVFGFFLFLLCQSVPMGRLGLGPWQIALPTFLYQNAFTAALGFPGPHYFSADYFPLIPWLFLFLAGSFLGVPLGRREGPCWLYRQHSRFLAAAGQKSLWIYLVHQPVLFSLFFLIRPQF